MRMLQAHAPAIFSVIVFIFMRFCPSTLIRYVCAGFRFDPLSRAFSNRCVFDENAQRVCVDGRRKLIEIHKCGRSLIIRGLSMSNRHIFTRCVDLCFQTSLEKWICFYSISNAITPTQLLCQMQANSFWAEFLPKNHIQRHKKKENLAVTCLRRP